MAAKERTAPVADIAKPIERNVPLAVHVDEENLVEREMEEQQKEAGIGKTKVDARGKEREGNEAFDVAQKGRQSQKEGVDSYLPNAHPHKITSTSPLETNRSATWL